MLFNSISTLGMSQRMRSSMTGLQLDMARANDELGTGKHYDVSGHLGARSSQAISLRNLYSRSEEYLLTTELLDSRMTLMGTQLRQMEDIGSAVLAQALTGAEQPSPTGWGLVIQAGGALDEMVGLLNATVGGRSLFSGVDVDAAAMRPISGDASGLPSPMQIVRDAIVAALGGGTAPTTGAETAAVVAVLGDLFSVRDPATPAPPPLSETYEGGFYTGTTAFRPGGTPNPRVAGRPEDGTELAYGVQANDQPVRDLMQGLFMLAAIDTSALPQDAYKPYMDEAIAKLNAGLDGLRTTQSELGVRHATLDGVKQRHEARMKVMNEQIIKLEDVDPYETEVRLSQIEAQLQATMNATVRISRLRLTDYL